MNKTILLYIPQYKSKLKMDKIPQFKNETVFVAS